MDLVEIGRQSWNVTWRHKALWVFGLFVVSSGGGGGDDRGVKVGVEELPAWFWPLLLAAVAIMLAALWMHVVSEGALIDAARRVRAGEAPRNREEVAAGRSAFGRVLRVKLAAIGALLSVVAVLSAPALLALSGVVPVAGAIAIGLPLLVAGVPVLLTAYFVYAYALRFAVLDRVGAAEAIRRGWRFLHGRVLESLQLLVLAFLAQVGGAVAAVAMALPGAGVGLVVWLVSGELVWAGILGGLVALPPILMAVGAAGTFRSSVWTLGFLESRGAAEA
jgi:hypothetical protein